MGGHGRAQAVKRRPPQDSKGQAAVPVVPLPSGPTTALLLAEGSEPFSHGPLGHHS